MTADLIIEAPSPYAARVRHILVNKTSAQFFFYVYFHSLHITGNYVPIIRRNNCIYTTRGICHSVWMTGMQDGIKNFHSILHTRHSYCIPDIHPAYQTFIPHTRHLSPSIVRVIKSRKVIWLRYVACMGREQRCIQGFGEETRGKEATWKTQT